MLKSIVLLLGIIAICNIIGVAVLVKLSLSFDYIEIEDKEDN